MTAAAARLRLGGAVVLALGLLTACASVQAPVTERATPIVDRPFAIDGRLSARHGSDGVAGSFTWLHEPGHDAIDLETPLGQTVARLDGNRERVRLMRPGKPVETARNWTSLTERGLGVAIPVEGLAWWIRGSPRSSTSAEVERDAEGRVSTLREDGWTVRYHYEDSGATRPKRITLAYPDTPPIDLSIVVDRWQ